MNTIYPKARESMLQGGIDLSGGTVKAALVDLALYTPDSGDQYYSTIADAVVGTPQTLTTKTFSLGIFNADDAVFPGLSGDTIEAVVIYIDTGIEAQSPLVCFIDNCTGLPFTPSGGSATLRWSASGIFQL